MTQRFQLRVEYDGRAFMGWQRQAHGASVQGAVEDALAAITNGPVTLFAAGRTDAGVHATGQVSHVDVARALTPFRLAEALNARLRLAGHAVAITGARLARPDFHARFDCVERAYEYRIVRRRAPLTWEAGLAWRVPAVLDVAAMRDAAAALVGQHDFTTFRSAQCQANSPVRTLDTLDVLEHADRITIVAVARSFLHHQVRSMVGCLKLVGAGRWSAADLAAALAARDRRALGLNAPPDGLWLTSARYAHPSENFTGW